MDLITGIVITVGTVSVAAIIIKSLEFRSKQTSLMARNGTLSNKKPSKTQLSDYLENLDQALEQATIIYNDQYQKCIDQRLTKEQAIEVLKPLKDKVDLLNTIKKYEWIARPAAQIGDKAITKITSVIGEM